MLIIDKLKKSGITGRSGSGFPTGLKWEMVKREKADKKYIICNASEGEPGVFKDEYILNNYPKDVLRGIKIALDTFPNSEAFIYLRKDLFRSQGRKLKKLIGRDKIKLFCEPGGYLCGEETTLIESMEGNRFEPRNRPPYPFKSGLKGKPTLINNVETFYYISKIKDNNYENTRFYCISGKVKNKGVFELPENFTVKKILEKTENFSKNNFFVQVGGGACGEIMGRDNLDRRICGSGSIVVYGENHNPIKLMKKWINFYINENCGRCVPCREGVYRIKEMLNQPSKIDWNLFKDILENMKETSFCGLGTSMPTGFLSLMKYIKLQNNKS